MINQELIFFSHSVRKMRTYKSDKINFSDDFVDFLINELTLIHDENANRILIDNNFCNEVDQKEVRIRNSESVIKTNTHKGEENGKNKTN